MRLVPGLLLWVQLMCKTHFTQPSILPLVLATRRCLGQKHNRSATLFLLSVSDLTAPLIPALKTRAFHLFCGSLSSESDTCRPVTNSFSGLQVMGVPGVLALFSSQRKNPVLVSFGALCVYGAGAKCGQGNRKLFR